MTPIDAVGFDLFNTLITVEKEALSEAVDRLLGSLERSGLAVDRDRFITDHRDAAKRFLEKTREDGRETHNRFWIQAALEAQEIFVSPDDPAVAEAVEAYFSAFLDSVRIIPGTHRMLDQVGSRFRVGLLSNFTHAPAARAILDVTGLAPYFPVCAISGDIGFRKPHARAFKALVNGLGTDGERILYVGDDPEPDVTGARQNGLIPVWSTYVRDHGLAFAPGYVGTAMEPPAEGVPRISEWPDLIALLREEHGMA